MKAKTTLLAAVTCLTGIAAIALAFGKGISDQNSFLGSFASVRAAATNRNITITYGNTYRGLYYKDVWSGNFKEDINSVFFKMQDDQAYGYIHTSGSINIKSEDNCIAAFWSNGSTCYFEVNYNYMYYADHYTSESDESVITMVKFRKPTQIVMVLDKGNKTSSDRCLDITCDDGSSSTYVDDAVANSRTYTYVIKDDISEGKEIQFNAEDAAGVALSGLDQ